MNNMKTDKQLKREVDKILAKSKESFRKELQHLINRYSMENSSDTPDFMLADYLMSCLEAYNNITTIREKWYGRAPKVVEPQPVFQEQKLSERDLKDFEDFFAVPLPVAPKKRSKSITEFLEELDKFERTSRENGKNIMSD